MIHDELDTNIISKLMGYVEGPRRTTYWMGWDANRAGESEEGLEYSDGPRKGVTQSLWRLYRTEETEAQLQRVIDDVTARQLLVFSK